MVSIAAAGSSLSLLSKPSLIFKPIRAIPRISSSLSSNSKSSSPSPLKFNISFAPSKPKSDSETQDTFRFIDQNTGGQIFIPWIVRGDDGTLKLQEQPPSRFLHSMSDPEIKTEKKKKIKIKKVSDDKRVAQPPKYSKAARRHYNENIKVSSQRLSKVLAAAGGCDSYSYMCLAHGFGLLASRRSSEELIFEGRVTVNGSVCNTPQTQVDPAKDVIYVNGNRLPKKLPPKVYLALNKPKGYICSSGEKESKSVMSLFDDYMKTWDKTHLGLPKPRLFTVGRLDVATTGLIIVTNDGDFAQSISHPSSGLSKEYIAVIDGGVGKQHLMAISKGTIIDGVHCIPDSVELLPRQPDISRHRLRIVVHEGRNHEVRELVKSAGLEIHSLKRVRIGGFRLPADLGIGSYTELKQSDLKAIGWKK